MFTESHRGKEKLRQLGMRDFQISPNVVVEAEIHRESLPGVKCCRGVSSCNRADEVVLKKERGLV